MLRTGLIVIPLIGRNTDHPSDPIACRAAIARSAGQGRRPVFRKADTSSDNTPPENIGRRRSLALDRSEHGGRLTAFGRSVPQPHHSAFRRVMRVCVTCMMLVLSAVAGYADPAPLPLPDSAFGERHDATDPWAAAITEASSRFDIPEDWIRAVMGAESHGDVRAVSPKGARGLMQIMPPIWDELRALHRLGDDPFNPHDNIIAGTAYLRALYDSYDMPGALAAYNAGPARYEEHKLLGVPLPRETLDYLDTLAPIFGSIAPTLFAGSGKHAAGTLYAPLFAIDTATDSRIPTSAAESLLATDKRRDRQAEPAETNSPDVQTD